MCDFGFRLVLNKLLCILKLNISLVYVIATIVAVIYSYVIVNQIISISVLLKKKVFYFITNSQTTPVTLYHHLTLTCLPFK